MVNLFEQNAWWLSMVIGVIGITISLLPTETKKILVSLIKWLIKPTSVIIPLINYYNITLRDG